MPFFTFLLSPYIDWALDGFPRWAELLSTKKGKQESAQRFSFAPDEHKIPIAHKTKWDRNSGLVPS